MKKTALVLALVAVVLFGVYLAYDSAANPGITFNCNCETSHKSATFTDEEINAAIKEVKKKFKDFEGCDLKELRYDEEIRHREAEAYLTTGGGSDSKIENTNVMILVSRFDVDNSSAAAAGGFNGGTTYDNWLWILTRSSEGENWEVVDWGY